MLKLKLIIKLKVIFLLCSTHKTVTFSMVGHIRIRDGPHAGRGLRTADVEQQIFISDTQKVLYHDVLC